MAQCFYVVDSLAFVSMKKAAEYALENEIKLINKYNAKTMQRVKTLEQKVDIIPAAETKCDCGKDHEEPFFADSDGEEEVSSDDEAPEEAPPLEPKEAPKVAESKVEMKAVGPKKKKSNKA
jgi:hypothetical protein